ncbi:hypothetical protein DPQ33_17840 [Oceanidesulfovibrio indonesiensis]|uniref:Uncharacterized protein n=1 Tax=Oceanidesulfovibrio indonesiensis TaxID=54767 RepID=A0A7M3MA02_9BACT|nr:hypothetical protein [Oceanidesulfovibrio indonesiensis]TVM14107.1 hypothetical protein DPQ33_17840 [Oceanidesulfovibrio indonesiensis]
MRARFIVPCLMAFILAFASVAQADQAGYLQGYIYTLNGERQNVTRFFNVGFHDYVYVHDGVERRIPARELQAVENRGLNKVMVTVRGQRPVRGTVKHNFQGAPIQLLVGDLASPITFEFYDRTRGKIARGEVTAEEVKKIVFK